MGWTIDQERAIYTDTGQGNLLVSAAAGSGKTAVLVERILQKLISGKSTIDRLLIVTFTEAAASEMREKIIKRLGEHLADADDKKFIKSQIRLAETADILTIDAFCSRVVKNNFHILGIDPNINVADSSTAALMINDAIGNVFDRIYKSDDEEIKLRFCRLTDFYAKDRTNEPLRDMIVSIYRFTESFAEPLKWLKNAAEMYNLPPMEWASVKRHETETRKAAKLCLNEITELFQMQDVTEEVLHCAEYAREITESICNAPDWDGIYEIYKTHFSTPKKRAAFMARVNELEISPCSNKLKFAMGALFDIFESGKDKTPIGITKSSEYINEFYEPDTLTQEAEDIYWLFSEFTKEYRRIKEEKSIYEFSDIEHLAYELFRDNESVKTEYINKYDEILIDEYQDTNMLQDTIFSLISKNNIFMVGDLKQSIYRFRKGDPYIFKSKAALYKKPSSPHTLITLSQNFRSRKEVLDSVNDVFSVIMSESAGDVDYSGDELIVRDDEYEYYLKSATDCKSELHYLSITYDKGLDRDKCEAEFTARKIDELLKSGATVYDKEQSAMRPIQKRDIVILQNSLKYNCDILSEELSRRGINSYIDRGSFFDCREITVMLSLISVINNMHQDIPLISVMRSPIGGFTDDELAMIKIHTGKCDDFISSVRKYIKDGENKQLKARLYEFVTNISRWRDYVRRKSVSQLIWAIYEETCFYDIMGALEEGEEAQTNLRLLYERAKQFESAGFKGVFNFIKYIKQIEDNPRDMGGAKLVGENHDVVRIMTIHKSKGLEFPYVFLLGMGRMFPHDDNPRALRLHKDYGIGLPQIHYDKHYARKTHTFELISKINHAEAISEQMRLLYVAMTRPKEKLYAVVCQARKANETAHGVLEAYKDTFYEKMRPEEALKARGFYDWLCPAVSVSDSWKVFAYDIEETPDVHQTQKTDAANDFCDSTELKDSVYKILDYTYPDAECYTIPSRTSVTQLKELSQSPDETVYEPDNRRQSDINDIAELMFSPLHQKPQFMLDKGKKPANEIGTLYHLVMAQLDFDVIREKGTDGVDCELLRLVSQNIIRKGDLEYISIDKIKAFFKSDLAERMMKSDNINREKPFQINISAVEYDSSLPPRYENETVILQGIIDCFFEEPDGFVLFDYKTDKVRNNTSDIKKQYQKQLELYVQAIEKLTGKKVKESYLYLFDTNEVI